MTSRSRFQELFKESPSFGLGVQEVIRNGDVYQDASTGKFYHRSSPNVPLGSSMVEVYSTLGADEGLREIYSKKGYPLISKKNYEDWVTDSNVSPGTIFTDEGMNEFNYDGEPGDITPDFSGTNNGLATSSTPDISSVNVPNYYKSLYPNGKGPFGSAQVNHVATKDSVFNKNNTSATDVANMDAQQFERYKFEQQNANQKAYLDAIKNQTPKTYGGLTGGQWAQTGLGIASLVQNNKFQNKQLDLAEDELDIKKDTYELAAADAGYKKEDGTTSKQRVAKNMGSALHWA